MLAFFIPEWIWANPRSK